MCENYQEMKSLDSFSEELYITQELGVAEPVFSNEHIHDWLTELLLLYSGPQKILHNSGTCCDHLKWVYLPHQYIPASPKPSWNHIH